MIGRCDHTDYCPYCKPAFDRLQKRLAELERQNAILLGRAHSRECGWWTGKVCDCGIKAALEQKGGA